VDTIDDYKTSPAFSDREKAVLLMADWMAFRSKGQMDEPTLATMRKHFSEEEMVELGIYFAVVTGFQKFNTVFNILYACEI
jgi:alkylhydroperoxidase family enzyme